MSDPIFNRRALDPELDASFSQCPHFHKYEEVHDSVNGILDAFPDRDIAGHCDYHLAKIRAAQAEERFWTELKLDLAKKGAWGLLIIIVGLIMIGVTAKLGLGAAVAGAVKP